MFGKGLRAQVDAILKPELNETVPEEFIIRVSLHPQPLNRTEAEAPRLNQTTTPNLRWPPMTADGGEGISGARAWLSMPLCRMLRVQQLSWPVLNTINLLPVRMVSARRGEGQQFETRVRRREAQLQATVLCTLMYCNLDSWEAQTSSKRP